MDSLQCVQWSRPARRAYSPSMKPPKPPGPIRRALFQDVPYILDSLWRRTEFRLHRIDGTVEYSYRFLIRAPFELVLHH